MAPRSSLEKWNVVKRRINPFSPVDLSILSIWINPFLVLGVSGRKSHGSQKMFSTSVMKGEI